MKSCPPAISFSLKAFLFAGLLSLAACDKKPDPAPTTKPATSAPAQPKLRIAVVPKGTTHEYWKSIHAGAVNAEKELGNIEITFRGPEKEDDREQQVSLMENLISAKYDAIVLAPLDENALVAPVKQATAAHIPVVIMDSGLKAVAGTDYVSFVATDNEKGGSLAGEKLAAQLGGKGKILILRYIEGSASTALREKGFIDAAAKAGLTVIDPKRYAGPTRASAQDAAENLLAADSNIQGIFCPNESATFGMLLALKSRGLAGKIKFIGFDSSKETVEALAAGQIDGLVVQSPIRMGYLAVKAAADFKAGKKIDPRIDTGVTLITKDTMNTPESKELLSPDLDKLLAK